MAAQPTNRLSPEEYLAFERAADTKHEYYHGDVFAMAGASYAHTVIISRLTRHLGNLLNAQSCEVLPNDLRVRVSQSYTYPDVVIVCGPPQFADDQKDTLLNPKVLMEVLSPATEAHDRGFKFAEYRKIESLQEYVLVSQQEARIEVFFRREAGQWLLSEFVGLESALQLDSLQCSLPLAEVYAGLL